MDALTQMMVLMVATSTTFLISRPAAAAETGVLRDKGLFLTCPVAQQHADAVLSANVLTDSARSVAECAVLCRASAGCAGVAACPGRDWAGRPAGVLCRGMEADVAQLLRCPPGDLGVAGSDQCVFMHTSQTTADVTTAAEPPQETTQLELTTTPVEAGTSSAPEATTQPVCANGGTFDGTRCWCPLPHAGSNCSRYMRDCSEGAMEQNNTGPDGTYTIQPRDSPTSFEVHCTYDGDGTTYTLRKKFPDAGDWTNNDWNASSGIGFGQLNPIPHNSENFFIGLEKTRQITIQAEYLMHIFMFYNTWANKTQVYYWNFTLGPDSSGFEPSYSLYESNNSTQGSYADNMLQGDHPVKFSTNDRCYPADCTKTDGWFGANGNGFRMLSYPLIWRIGGVEESLVYFQLALTRTSGYYGD